jgi:hypothetical protein
VLRELEQEIEAQQGFAAEQEQLRKFMDQKSRGEREQAGLRLQLQRLLGGYAAAPDPEVLVTEAQERLRALRVELDALDQRIAPLAQRASRLVNERWGPLMFAGNDKSRLARQVERHADVYTSRVSNLLYLTPFGYLRAPRGSLPHDP